jgi:hypothetical protein
MPTPERARLATAIERHREVAETLARYRAAATKAREATIEAVWAVGTAEALLAEAQTDAPHSYVTALLSEQPAAASAVEQAERALTEAKARSGYCRDGEAALKAELVALENRAEGTRAARDEALREVIKSSPGVARLWADYEAAQRHVATLTGVFKVLGSLRLPKPADNWEAIREWPAEEGAVAPWRDALAALENDPATPLPGDVADPPPVAA